MRLLRGGTALVTGATSSTGRATCRRLAREGVKVVVSGRREETLAEVVAELGEIGAEATAVPADLAERGDLERLVRLGEAALGSIDLLVHGAGVEPVAAFTAYRREELAEAIEINLTAPLLLTHMVLPGMLERGRGHVVFVSSLAGKIGPAYNEPYAAAKAGLLGLNQSLRAEYRSTPVGFSAVLPGFTAGDEMYEEMREDDSLLGRLIGETTAAEIADRVIEAIVDDRPEVLEVGSPIRPLLALAEISPRLTEWLSDRLGSSRSFRRAAAVRGRLP
jgi:short-subunit dehydrogenase